MGFLSKLVGKSVSVPVKEVLDGIDGLVTSDEERAALANARAALDQIPALKQAEITLAEAQHRTIFVAGWRPAAGWVCAAGLAFVFVVNPCIQWATGSPGPEIPSELLFQLILALLGLGGLRTFEKAQGAAR